MIDPEGGEGESYLCTWKKEAKGFRLVVKDRPELEGSGATFAEARSRLAERILLELGDGEPVFQFDKPLPKEVLPEEYSDPEIIWVSGNDTALIRDPGGLFKGGICSLCGNPVGKETARRPVVSSPPLSKSDGAEAKHIGSLFSEAFIKVLEDTGSPPLEFREVQLEGKGEEEAVRIGRPSDRGSGRGGWFPGAGRQVRQVQAQGIPPDGGRGFDSLPGEGGPSQPASPGLSCPLAGYPDALHDGIGLEGDPGKTRSRQRGGTPDWNRAGSPCGPRPGPSNLQGMTSAITTVLYSGWGDPVQEVVSFVFHRCISCTQTSQGSAKKPARSPRRTAPDRRRSAPRCRCRSRR